MGVTTVLLALVCVLVPLYAVGGLTVLTAGVYAYFGVRRWTALLAYPAIIIQVPLMIYGLGRRMFVWGGRRYRWYSKFEVKIII